VEFRVLGWPDASHGGERLDIGPPKQRAVLAALLLSANQVLSTEHLIDSVWWRVPVAAQANLRAYRSRLRRILRIPEEGGSRLQSIGAGGYQLTVYPGELDLERFNALADSGEQALRNGQLSAGADSLDRALRLWSGRLLDGIAYGPALQAVVLRIEERRLAVAEQWAQARLDLGQADSVVADLRALVKEQPMRERLWKHLILALHGSGRSGEALGAYAELRALLAGELGAEPGPELRRLHERILRSDDSVVHASRADHAERFEPALPRRRLPAGPRRSYGRADGLAGLTRTLRGAEGRSNPPMVAVDALAEVGTSTLALAAAPERAEQIPDGQFHVDLPAANTGRGPRCPCEVLDRSIGVVVVDEHSLIRAGLVAMLEATPGYKIVGVAADSYEAAGLMETTTPNVVLMNTRIPGTEGIEAIRRILARSGGSTPRVLVLAASAADDYAYNALLAGVSGVVANDTSPTRLLAAIAAVAAGEVLLTSTVVGRLIAAYGRRLTEVPVPSLDSLTHRELDMLRLVGAGLSNSEIAKSLGIAEATVKTHVNRVLAKLGVCSRAQAVVIAYESGLVTPCGSGPA
jgi:DNA-binding NarL/FixJ family response regulator/DNA-binding SARP family transcriptional activator